MNSSAASKILRACWHRNKFLRLTIGQRRSGFYFHKNCPVIPSGNKIDFAASETIISGNNFKSLFLQKVSGQVFALVTGFDFIAHNYILPLIIEFTIMSTTKKYIEGFTRQLADALKIGQSLDLERPGSDIRNIVIAGMGASGISANLVESLTFGRIPIPITVCKSYNIPQFVSPHTLFIACSYSGDAEETVAALNKALLKRAQVIAVASGGKLLDICKEYNLYYIQLPSGSDSPRAMLAYNMNALFYILVSYEPDRCCIHKGN